MSRQPRASGLAFGRAVPRLPAANPGWRATACLIAPDPDDGAERRSPSHPLDPPKSSPIVTAPSAPAGPSIGIDFGTTNTVVAHRASRWPDRGPSRSTAAGRCSASICRCWCFWEERQQRSTAVACRGRTVGDRATPRRDRRASVHSIVQDVRGQPIVQGNPDIWPALTNSRICWRRSCEPLFFRVGAIAWLMPAEKVVVGRPVRFAGGNPDDALADSAAIARRSPNWDCANEQYVYEPVGAAFFLAQRLREDAAGAGPSSFRRRHQRFLRRAFRLDAGGRASLPRPLGHAGIGDTGDTFDYRIIDEVVSPQPRQGRTLTKPSARSCRCPKAFSPNFARWNQLAMMKNIGRIEGAGRAGPACERIRNRCAKFIEIVENDLGFFLYRAVSRAEGGTVAQGSCAFYSASSMPASIFSSRSRARKFETWIREGRRFALPATVDEALGNAGRSAAAPDRQGVPDRRLVIHPGHSAGLCRPFRRRSDRIRQRVRVDWYGLALIGQSANLADWVVQPA